MLSLPWSDQTTAIVVGVVSVLAVAISKYRRAIKKRLDQLEDPLRIVRKKTKDKSALHPKVQQLELNPDFVKQCESPNYPKMTSLGDYLASLHPQGDLPEFLDTALENAITRALLKHLGKHLGKAVLPVMGTGFVQDAIRDLTATIFAHIETRAKRTKQGVVPLPIGAIPSVAQLNYQFKKTHGEISVNAKDWKTSSDSPIYLLRGGEVGFAPSFSEVVTPPPSDEELLVPNPFIISKHWDRAILKMEDLLVAAGDDTKWKSTPMEEDDSDDEGEQQPAFVYDANSKAMKSPVPIDERLLPDLHLGWGSALCTHTHQEILKNRLLSTLLNRLASNYFYRTYTDEPPFQVYVNDDKSSKPMTRPEELIQALLDMGHEIESCVRSNITTFGIAVCCKEEDDSWTSIPLAIFMHNGFHDKDGNEVFACLPHSGLNIEIRGGPLLQHGSIQHYIAIEGKECAAIF